MKKQHRGPALGLALLTLSFAACAVSPNAADTGTSPIKRSSTKSTKTTSPSPSSPTVTGTGGTGSSTSPSTAASSSSAASTAPSTDASATASTAATSTSNATTDPNLTSISGVAYDDNGTALAVPYTLHVVSLDPQNHPFDTTLNSGNGGFDGGTFTMPNVPVGVQLAVTISKTGYTTRTRVVTAQTAIDQNNFDFGVSSTATSFNATAAPFFLSDYPEITSVGLDNNGNYVVQLSEPLDSTNKVAFEAALRIFPANSAATNGLSTPPVLNTTGNELKGDADFDYGVKFGLASGATFGGARARITQWNTAGDQATLSVPALLASNSDAAPAQYQLALVSDGATKIVDIPANGQAARQLGTDSTGSQSTYPGAGKVINNVFYNSANTVVLSDSTAAKRWAAMHDNAYAGTVLALSNTTGPNLVSVQKKFVTNLGTQIVLNFDHPVGAYKSDQDQFADPSVVATGTYTFEAGASTTVDAATLTGTATQHLSSQDANVGNTDTAEFDISDVGISFASLDGKTLSLFIPGSTTTDWFVTGAQNKELAVHIKGLKDPAGNSQGTTAQQKCPLP